MFLPGFHISYAARLLPQFTLHVNLHLTDCTRAAPRKKSVLSRVGTPGTRRR